MGPLLGRRAHVDPQLAGTLISSALHARGRGYPRGAPASLCMGKTFAVAEYFEEGGSSNAISYVPIVVSFIEACAENNRRKLL